MPSPLNLAGKQLKHYQVIERTENDRWGHTRWICLCNCGTQFVTPARCIQTEQRKSCGCQSYKDIKHGNQTQDPRQVSLNAYRNSYIQRCKRDDILWQLTQEQFQELTSQKCHYCKVQPYNKINVYLTKAGKYRPGNKTMMDKAWIKVNGIDRMDNSQGYLTTNVVTCCKICNYAKRELSYDEFMNWINEVRCSK